MSCKLVPPVMNNKVNYKDVKVAVTFKFTPTIKEFIYFLGKSGRNFLGSTLPFNSSLDINLAKEKLSHSIRGPFF